MTKEASQAFRVQTVCEVTLLVHFGSDGDFLYFAKQHGPYLTRCKSSNAVLEMSCIYNLQIMVDISGKDPSLVN